MGARGAISNGRVFQIDRESTHSLPQPLWGERENLREKEREKDVHTQTHRNSCLMVTLWYSITSQEKIALTSLPNLLELKM